MAKAVKQKSFKCTEWILQSIPAADSTTASEVFSFQGNECYFEYYSGITGRRNINPILMFRSKKELQRPIAITVRVLSNSETLSHVVGSITGPPEKIWSSLQSYFINSILTFQVIFHVDYLADDKCIQTASYLNVTSSLPEDFSKLLETGLDHDLTMKCCDESIKAHKIVLNTRSGVFKAMLKNDMKEGQTGVVEIKDMDINYFQDFVKYLYTDILPELTFDKAKVLYEAGDKYAVKSLMHRCAEYLEDNLSPENAFECYAVADAHSDQSLMDVIKNFILEKRVYLQEEHWLPFHETFPKVALEVYRLSYREKGD